MRRTTTSSRTASTARVVIVSATAIALLLAWVASAAPASTRLYVPESARAAGLAGEQLSQFAIAGDGSLTPLAPAVLGGISNDIAITPDGRFAYVTRSASTDVGLIAQFARAADGRMEPLGEQLG